jgi:hypothetical protein
MSVRGPYGDFSVYYGWVITPSCPTTSRVAPRAPGGAIVAGRFWSGICNVIITTGNYFHGTGPAM